MTAECDTGCGQSFSRASLPSSLNILPPPLLLSYITSGCGPMHHSEHPMPSDSLPPSAPHTPFSAVHTSSSSYPQEPQRILISQEQQSEDKLDSQPVFMKGPKRKRLAKVYFSHLTFAPSPTHTHAHLYLGLRCMS